MAAHAIPLAAGACSGSDDGVASSEAVTLGLFHAEAPSLQVWALQSDPTPTDESPTPAALVGATATGSGCPAASWGTWTRALEGGPTAFGIRFTGYGVTSSTRETSVSRDCQIVLQLESPRNVAYAVRAISYAGEATLRAGARANVEVGHDFAPADGDAESDELGVRQDGRFGLSHEVPEELAQWSPCGVEHDLRISTHLTLRYASGSDASAVRLREVANLQLYGRSCTP